jgi:hypothetical protein
MYMVYWTEIHANNREAHQQLFESEDMVNAMKFMEDLRTRQRNGDQICFIVLSSENPHSVGKAGVADPPPDYNWTKRRRRF